MAQSALLSTRARLREAAWKIMQAATGAVEPGAAVRRHLALEGDRLAVGRASGETLFYDLGQVDRVLLVGGGKAGEPMAAAVAGILGQRLTGGVVVVKRGHAASAASPTGRVSVVEAGHPIPDEDGLAGASAIVDLLGATTERDLVIALVSGGASALLTLPQGAVTLSDLQALTRLLLGCGATINEINIVRKHLEQLKGGQLARLASPALVISLILSDVVGDPLDVIASGPTVPDPSTFSDACAVLERYDLLDQVPISIADHLAAGARDTLPETPKPGEPLFERVQNVVVGSNALAAGAAVRAAEALGFDSLLLTTYLEGEAREVGRVVAGLAKGLASGQVVRGAARPLERPACLVLGGETTVTLRGAGRGGRNQEMALSAALALSGWSGVLVACLATDGNDGPTDAAGAFADGETVGQAASLGLDAHLFLAQNDSYGFFAPLGDLIVTGPTRTNVNDLVFILAAGE